MLFQCSGRVKLHRNQSNAESELKTSKRYKNSQFFCLTHLEQKYAYFLGYFVLLVLLKVMMYFLVELKVK